MCVCGLALIIQHAKRMRRITLPYMTLPPSVPYLYTLSYKRHDFLNEMTKNVRFVQCTALCATLHIVTRYQRHIAINVQRAS